MTKPGAHVPLSIQHYAVVCRDVHDLSVPILVMAVTSESEQYKQGRHMMHGHLLPTRKTCHFPKDTCLAAFESRDDAQMMAQETHIMRHSNDRLIFELEVRAKQLREQARDALNRYLAKWKNEYG